MALTVRALASGSSGNAFLVETDQATLLLDAGLPSSHVLERLEELGTDLDRLKAIVVTHEHTDHASGATALSRKLGVPLYGTSGTLQALRTRGCDLVSLIAERATMVDDVEVVPFAVPHDAAEPIGLFLAHEGHQVVLATDLGCIDARVREWAALADLLILDTNHDLVRLWHGPYPASLKRRIASPRGHLSNDQAAECIRHAAENGRTRFAWLAHLSETNNSQRRATATVRARLGSTAFAADCVGRSGLSLTWRSTDRFLQGRLF